MKGSSTYPVCRWNLCTWKLIAFRKWLTLRFRSDKNTNPKALPSVVMIPTLLLSRREREETILVINFDWIWNIRNFKDADNISLKSFIVCHMWSVCWYLMRDKTILGLFPFIHKDHTVKVFLLNSKSASSLQYEG